MKKNKNKVFKVNKKTKKHKVFKSNFEKAYNILMDYWDLFDEDSKVEIDKRLNEVGL